MNGLVRLVCIACGVACGIAASGCELFDEARCDVDRDCPDSVPFCVDGVCDDDDDGEGEGEGGEGEGEFGEGEGEGGEGEGEGGEGEGEGEGEGTSCAFDDPCNGGLCCSNQDGCVGHQDTCIGDVAPSCAASSGSEPRAADGPVIFDVTGNSAGPCSPDGAGVNVTVRYLDPDRNMWLLSDGQPALFAATQAFGALFPYVFQAGQVLEQDGDSFSGTFTVVGCVDSIDEPIAVWVENLGDIASNVVCLDL